MSIEALANQLKLTYIRDNAKTFITEERHKTQDYSEFLESILRACLISRSRCLFARFFVMQVSVCAA
jgi:hypothetical protein